MKNTLASVMSLLFALHLFAGEIKFTENKGQGFPQKVVKQ